MWDRGEIARHLAHTGGIGNGEEALLERLRVQTCRRADLQQNCDDQTTCHALSPASKTGRGVRSFRIRAVTHIQSNAPSAARPMSFCGSHTSPWVPSQASPVPGATIVAMTISMIS